jgi:hypothetical protein
MGLNPGLDLIQPWIGLIQSLPKPHGSLSIPPPHSHVYFSHSLKPGYKFDLAMLAPSPHRGNFSTRLVEIIFFPDQVSVRCTEFAGLKFCLGVNEHLKFAALEIFTRRAPGGLPISTGIFLLDLFPPRSLRLFGLANGGAL